jgi:hypothetical protein
MTTAGERLQETWENTTEMNDYSDMDDYVEMVDNTQYK